MRCRHQGRVATVRNGSGAAIYAWAMRDPSAAVWALRSIEDPEGPGLPQLMERPVVNLNAGAQITQVTGVKYTTARLAAGETLREIAAHLSPSGSTAPLVLQGADYDDLTAFSARQRGAEFRHPCGCRRCAAGRGRTCG